MRRVKSARTRLSTATLSLKLIGKSGWFHRVIKFVVESVKVIELRKHSFYGFGTFYGFDIRFVSARDSFVAVSTVFKTRYEYGDEGKQ